MTSFPYDADELQKYVVTPVIAFIANFEIYLRHQCDLEKGPTAALKAVLKFIPKGIFPIIDGVAYSSASEFIQRNGLHRHSRIPEFGDVPGDHILESLAFLLKGEWQRGYLLHKFRRLDYLPHPNDSLDPRPITDKITSWGTSDRSDLGTNIDVFLQRVVSFTTEPEAIKLRLQALPEVIYSIVEPYLNDWIDVVRTACGFGILTAKAEYELDEEKLAKIEYTVKNRGSIGSIVINPQIKGDFITTHSYIANVADTDVARALRHVADEVVSSDELTEEARADLLQQLKELSRQAALPKESRTEPGVLKAVLESIGGGIGAAGGLADVWATWGEAISRFFGF